MADDFDQSSAEDRHYRIMKQLQGVRDGLAREIDYYYNTVPKTEDEQQRQRSELRSRIGSLQSQLNDFVNNM